MIGRAGVYFRVPQSGRCQQGFSHKYYPDRLHRPLATYLTLLSLNHSCTSEMSTLEAILSNPAYHDYLAILKGARNGFVYGVKVRFPHALIMAILFGRGESVFN